MARGCRLSSESRKSGWSGLPRRQAREMLLRAEKKRGCAQGAHGAGRAALGRGRVGHMGRVCIVMRAAGARVRAVVGAGASSEERFLTCGNEITNIVPSAFFSRISFHLQLPYAQLENGGITDKPGALSFCRGTTNPASPSCAPPPLDLTADVSHDTPHASTHANDRNARTRDIT